MPAKGSVSFRMGGHEGGRQDFPWLQNSIPNVLKVKGGALTQIQRQNSFAFIFSHFFGSKATVPSRL